jgi:hypothetical protein
MGERTVHPNGKATDAELELLVDASVDRLVACALVIDVRRDLEQPSAPGNGKYTRLL